jgi:3'-phosphoadenosine 5'-phosphosulfate sulfotransferase (PAPS reductase)/FAD synthetase
LRSLIFLTAKCSRKMKSEKNMTMISFSGGRSSAMMTKILCDNIPENERIICFANTGKEHEGTLKFVHDFEVNFNLKVIWIEFCKDNGFKIVNFETASRNVEPFSDLITKRKFTPNVVTRFCTTELKIRPLKKYMKSIGFKNWDNAVGIRYDEQRRIARLAHNCEKEPYDTVAPLNKMQVTKADVLRFWSQQSFNLEIDEYLGNCDMCFLKARTKLKKIIKDEPERASWWIEQEMKVGGEF